MGKTRKRLMRNMWEAAMPAKEEAVMPEKPNMKAPEFMKNMPGRSIVDDVRDLRRAKYEFQSSTPGGMFKHAMQRAFKIPNIWGSTIWELHSQEPTEYELALMQLGVLVKEDEKAIKGYQKDLKTYNRLENRYQKKYEKDMRQYLSDLEYYIKGHDKFYGVKPEHSRFYGPGTEEGLKKQSRSYIALEYAYVHNMANIQSMFETRDQAFDVLRYDYYSKSYKFEDYSRYKAAKEGSEMIKQKGYKNIVDMIYSSDYSQAKHSNGLYFGMTSTW